MSEKNLAQVIREQMQSSGKRFWAGDNISQWITDKLIRHGFLDDQDRNAITPPYVCGPSGEGY